MPRHTDRNGLRVHHPRYLHFPGKPLWNAHGFARAGAAGVRVIRPDVVVADYAWPAAAAVPRLAAAGIPGVVSARGSDLRIAEADGRLVRRLADALRVAPEWCAVGEHLLLLMNRIAGERGRGRLIPNGVDGELFTITPRPEARSQCGVNPGARVVLVVGHLIPRKDPLLALEVFAAARKRLGDGRLVFVGEGPLEADLRDAAERLGIAERVVLAGASPPHQLAAWYSAADCLLLCSTWEGRPNVALEALACGRPVLATINDGSAEVLRDQQRMLADTRQPGELADRLVGLIEDPPPPERLRSSVLHLTWSASCDLLERCLERAAGGEP